MENGWAEELSLTMRFCVQFPLFRRPNIAVNQPQNRNSLTVVLFVLICSYVAGIQGCREVIAQFVN